MKPFDLHILTMNKPFFEGKCSSLVVPIKSGQYGILANHCNWVSVIVPGEMKLAVEGGDGKQNVITAAVAGGIVKVEHNSVPVLVDTAERPEEIDENRAPRRRDGERANRKTDLNARILRRPGTSGARRKPFEGAHPQHDQ